MSVDEFEELTPAEFLTIWAGYLAKRNDEQRQQWEIARIATAMLVNIQLDEKSKIEPAKLWPLPWDGKQEAEEPIITIEQRRQMATELLSKT